jgi:hypothetical protein
MPIPSSVPVYQPGNYITLTPLFPLGAPALPTWKVDSLTLRYDDDPYLITWSFGGNTGYALADFAPYLSHDVQQDRKLASGVYVCGARAGFVVLQLEYTEISVNEDAPRARSFKGLLQADQGIYKAPGLNQISMTFFRATKVVSWGGNTVWTE